MPITSGTRNIGSSDNITRLNWSSSNAVACEGSNFDTSGNISGDIFTGHASLSIAPGQTKIFGVRCKNSENNWSAWKNVTIIKDVAPAPIPNRVPDNPIIKGADMSTEAPITALVGELMMFTYRSSDPDNDNLYYKVDWNNDGVMDVRLPAVGLVANNTPLSSTYSWLAVGTYTFQVKAVDVQGGESDWSSHSIVVTVAPVTPPLPPLVNLEVSKGLVRSGESVQVRVRISADYDVSCSLYGLGGAPVNINHLASSAEKIYTYSTVPLVARQQIKLECTPDVHPFVLPVEVRTAIINVVPKIEEI